MAVKKRGKKVKSFKGTNIRISDTAYKLLKVFTTERGYKLGVFCEMAALERMKNESTNNI